LAAAGRAVVIGAGIGGLAAAAGLHAAGWDVTVCERAAALEPVGADPVQMAETWGRGTVFGVMPLADGRVYCYAAAPAR
jgi:2-polyprenyl-6-methoxyphenol hydroxylase-like FAD-dependent oxidoreductase